jgi:predicted CXXCH cytochrome family protein
MKKAMLIVALAAALALVFAAPALATTAKTWNYGTDYYTWGSTPGSGVSTVEANMLKNVGANPTNPGVHGNYLANTAKCGICHSVHRANADGVKLLDTATASCAGCHRAGLSTVTDVVISWEAGGPHSSGTNGDGTYGVSASGCLYRTCHVGNPHGANGSDYKIVAAKLLSPNTDARLAYALADPTASGISVADLNAEATSTWDEATRSAVRTGYNCNQAGCHVQTLLTVLEPGYSEYKYVDYNNAYWDGIGGRSLANGGYVYKTGHLSVTGADMERAFAPVDTCVSCHDQTDEATFSGFTFPHSQTPYGTSNFGAARAWLWMGYAPDVNTAPVGMTASGMKAYDGACLKCHRDNVNDSGIGLTH